MRNGRAPSANPAATAVLLFGLCASYLLQDGDTPSGLAHAAAIGIGASLLVSTLVDFRRNLRNLVRTDIMALAALYFLTLFEFLFPQAVFDTLVNLSQTEKALPLCYLAFGGIALGRHWAPTAPHSLQKKLQSEFPTRLLVILFGIAIVGGYLYQFVSVKFDLDKWLYYTMSPRFSQPWGRGRMGDWKALLSEFGMILNLAPPIAGIIFATRKGYSKSTLLLVGLGLSLTLYSAFVGGTRNVLATYLATFSVAYAFSLPPERKRELIVVVSSAAGILLLCTSLMLQFRTIGFKNYVDGYRSGEIEPAKNALFVDYNLYVMAQLTDVFPDLHPYLGFEIPYLALIRPIPRAAWPGKPEGMSMSIEDAVGVDGLTLASSFVGEAYISGGPLGVFIIASVFGMIVGWWNRFGSIDNSPFGNLIFASGFFAAVISMRSMLVFTTAILPTLAALVLGSWLLRRQPVRRFLHFHETESVEMDEPHV